MAAEYALKLEEGELAGVEVDGPGVLFGVGEAEAVDEAGGTAVGLVGMADLFSNTAVRPS